MIWSFWRRNSKSKTGSMNISWNNRLLRRRKRILSELIKWLKQSNALHRDRLRIQKSWWSPGLILTEFPKARKTLRVWNHQFKRSRRQMNRRQHLYWPTEPTHQRSIRTKPRRERSWRPKSVPSWNRLTINLQSIKSQVKPPPRKPVSKNSKYQATLGHSVQAQNRSRNGLKSKQEKIKKTTKVHHQWLASRKRLTSSTAPRAWSALASR